MISLSTCFYHCNNWQELLLNIKKLGFFEIELDVNIPESWIDSIKKSVHNNEIKISSIHNKYRYSLSSLNEENRNLAVKYTLKTIELAAELSAKAVVVHLGEVETSFSGRDLYNYSLSFDLITKNKFLEKQKIAVWVERQTKVQPYLEKLMKSLDEIVVFASMKHVKIGIENRAYITDIPNIEEIKYILEKFNTPFLGYWHDVGHAEMSARLGYVEKHFDYFDNLQKYLIGMHLHDVKTIFDHVLPGCGDFDFGILKPFLQNPKIIKVLEVHKSERYSMNDIKKAIKAVSF